MLRYTNKIIRSLSDGARRRIIDTPRYAFSTHKFQSVAPLQKRIMEQIHQQESKNIGSEAILNSIKKHKWNVSTEDTLVQMTKQLANNTTVKVVFFIEPPHPEQQIHINEQQLQKTTQFGGDYQEFSVYVEKPGSEKVMYADFFLNQEDLRLLNLNFTKDYKAHRLVPNFNRLKSIYQGPDISTLEEPLNKKLHEFFEQIGINSELTSFIKQYSINEEHFKYVKWLKDLNEFVQQK